MTSCNHFQPSRINNIVTTPYYFPSKCAHLIKKRKIYLHSCRSPFSFLQNPTLWDDCHVYYSVVSTIAGHIRNNFFKHQKCLLNARNADTQTKCDYLTKTENVIYYSKQKSKVSNRQMAFRNRNQKYRNSKFLFEIITKSVEIVNTYSKS